MGMRVRVGPRSACPRGKASSDSWMMKSFTRCRRPRPLWWAPFLFGSIVLAGCGGGSTSSPKVGPTIQSALAQTLNNSQSQSQYRSITFSIDSCSSENSAVPLSQLTRADLPEGSDLLLFDCILVEQVNADNPVQVGSQGLLYYLDVNPRGGWDAMYQVIPTVQDPQPPAATGGFASGVDGFVLPALPAHLVGDENGGHVVASEAATKSTNTLTAPPTGTTGAGTGSTGAGTTDTAQTGAATPGSSAGTTSTAPSPGSTTGSSKAVASYSHCIQSAGGVAAKMQKCAVLLNGNSASTSTSTSSSSTTTSATGTSQVRDCGFIQGGGQWRTYVLGSASCSSVDDVLNAVVNHHAPFHEGIDQAHSYSSYEGWHCPAGQMGGQICDFPTSAPYQAVAEALDCSIAQGGCPSHIPASELSFGFKG